MTFAPGDDIRSVFRYHSSIFIEGVLEGGGGWEEEGGEGGEGGEVGGGRVGRMVGGLGDEGSFGGDGDGAEVPFSLKSIMQRNGLCGEEGREREGGKGGKGGKGREG